MRRASTTGLLSCALLLAAAPAAAQTWQLFATGKTAKVFFDRASVREEDGYVHYRMRIEFGEPRDSRDRKHRYKSSVSAQAASHSPVAARVRYFCFWASLPNARMCPVPRPL